MLFATIDSRAFAEVPSSIVVNKVNSGWCFAEINLSILPRMRPVSPVVASECPDSDLAGAPAVGRSGGLGKFFPR